VGSFTAGSVVLIQFPFSDLSHRKLRPAVVLADCGHGDWLLCQITSSPYSDSRAVQVDDADFRTGSLRITSYARPTKLFTAHHTLITAEVGVLHEASLKRITDAVIQLIKPLAWKEGRLSQEPAGPSIGCSPYVSVDRSGFSVRSSITKSVK
jgi:mRNA interferase MazF